MDRRHVDALMWCAEAEMLEKQREHARFIDSLFAEQPCYWSCDPDHTGCILPYGHKGQHMAIKRTVLCRCQGGWYPCETPSSEYYCPRANHDPGDEDKAQKFFIQFKRY